MRLALVLSGIVMVGCAPARPAQQSAPTTQSSPGEESLLSDIRRLTSGFSRAGEAYTSPDMNWIIFQATPPGEKQYRMYVAKLRREGSRIIGTEPPIRVSAEGSANTCGYFAPEGRSLIFATTGGRHGATKPATAPGYQRSSGTYRWDFPAEMEIVRADIWREGFGDAAKLETLARKEHWVRDGDRLLALELAVRRLTDNGAYDAECAYSPDGRHIVFASNRSGDVELYVMRADGSDPVQLTRAKGYDGGPFFSPDGKRLVYRSDRAGNDLLQIFTADLVFDASGNITGLAHERQLTTGSDVNWAPYWHPDGRHIIYTTSRHGHANYELYLMRDDGTNQTRITTHDGFDGLPVFSPDGKYLMWSSKRTSDNTTQVFLARFTMPGGA